MVGIAHKNNHFVWKVFYLIWLHPYPQMVQSLRLTETVIPYYGVLDNPTLLHCYFDLENSSLYSLKWYKDGHEFFRYKPKDDPPITVFPLNGVIVNENRSSINQVCLESTNFLSKGIYRCEISADAPSFQTLHVEQYMNVMVLPRKGPQLSGIHPWYNIRDNLTAQCSVEKTFPPPKLTWFVNDVQFDAAVCDCISYELFESGKEVDGTIYYSATTQLDLQLDTPYFRDGSLTIECKVTFSKSDVALRSKTRSNIKAGFGRHYANIFSTASISRQLPLLNPTLLSAILFAEILQKFVVT